MMLATYIYFNVEENIKSEEEQNMKVKQPNEWSEKSLTKPLELFSQYALDND